METETLAPFAFNLRIHPPDVIGKYAPESVIGQAAGEAHEHQQPQTPSQCCSRVAILPLRIYLDPLSILLKGPCAAIATFRD